MISLDELVPARSVVAVLRLESVEEALAICSCLAEAGLVLEVTLRTSVALECMAALRRHLPRAVIGAGTVLDAAQARAARDAGAMFGVSPGFSAPLAQAVRALDWPFIPGVATVSEAMAAADADFRLLKFFPAEASGGIGFLLAVASVLPQLRFCPTGGVRADNAAAYLDVPNVHAIGGSWMVVRDRAGRPDLAAIHAAVQACAALRG